MSWNDRFRSYRKQRNWRQSDVAEQLGVSVLTVHRWEQGHQQPGMYYRARLSELFGLSAQELELEEETPVQNTIIEAKQSGNTMLWMVPYARNPYFTGRDDLLDALERQFSPIRSDLATTIHRGALPQPQAIKGLGGIGKTQIAVEYAYRCQALGRYTHTLWINAASEETILMSFDALADLLPDLSLQDETDQRKLVPACIRWLDQCEQPWLLIVDNADDLSLIHPYLPHQGNGNILLTTRANAVGWLASSVEVGAMDFAEGMQLLLRRAQRFARASTDEINDAGSIVTALAQFPLALDQAGAYIEETGCSLCDYLHIYQQHSHVLLARRGRQATGYPESVATTWSLSFEHIEQVNPTAADLLLLCAFLSSDHIPEELFTQGAAYWPPALQQAVMDRITFEQMLETLLTFSLVKRLSADHVLSIHRLVQVIQMERLSSQEQRQWAERVVRAVHVVFPRDPKDEIDSWPQCQRYLGQAQACSVLIQAHRFLFPEAADVLDRAATYLRERALYTLAEPLYQQALSIWEQQVGPGRHSEADSLNNLALLYDKQGKYAEAEPLCQRALGIWEQQIGGAACVAIVLNTLANLYRQQGQYEQSRMHYLRALHIREQEFGPVHQEVAYSLTGLADLYRVQGQYMDAEPLYQRALRIQEQQWGPDHPHVASALIGLADLYHERGQYAKAMRLYQQALRIREQQLGPDHLETAEVLYAFAGFQLAQGRIQEAELLYRRALMIREYVLGANHPITVVTRERLEATLSRTNDELKPLKSKFHKKSF